MLPRNIALVLSWGLCSIVYSAVPPKTRVRRDLLDLADIFDALTGLDPSDFIPYGNWCGFGGGGQPIDLIDGCCQIHDDCYGEAGKGCPDDKTTHLIQYSWKINNQTVICEDETNCESSICKCDIDVVECISKHNHTYSENYRFIRN